MKCFLHLDREAIGRCAKCGHNLCGDCASNQGETLVCKTRCQGDGETAITRRAPSPRVEAIREAPTTHFRLDRRWPGLITGQIYQMAKKSSRYSRVMESLIEGFVLALLASIAALLLLPSGSPFILFLAWPVMIAVPLLAGLILTIPFVDCCTVCVLALVAQWLGWSAVVLACHSIYDFIRGNRGNDSD